MPRKTRLSTFGSLCLCGLILSSCAPGAAPPAAVYQAPREQVRQSVEEIARAFGSLPTYQALYLWKKRSDAHKITLTSATRINADANQTAVLNVNDERELVFYFSEKDGLTSVTYSKVGPTEQQALTVLNALDKRFVRVQLP